MTDHICRNCRWWSPNVAGKKAPDNIAFACKNPKLAMPHYDIGYENNNCAGVDDIEAGRVTFFVTGPEFGCVHWEAME